MSSIGELLTVADVMTALKVSKWRVYELIRSGELESVKIGRSRRIPADAVGAFVRELRQHKAA